MKRSKFSKEGITYSLHQHEAGTPAGGCPLAKLQVLETRHPWG